MIEQLTQQLDSLVEKRDKMRKIIVRMNVIDPCLPDDYRTLQIFDNAIGVRVQDLADLETDEVTDKIIQQAFEPESPDSNFPKAT